MPEPWCTRLVNEAGAKVLVDEATLWPEGQFVTTHLIVRTDFLEDNPKTVKKLLEGNLKAIDFANDNRTVAERLVGTGIFNATGQQVDPATSPTRGRTYLHARPARLDAAKSAKDAE